MNHTPSNREANKDAVSTRRPNATVALVAIGLFTTLLAELAGLLLAARLIDEQMTARMLSAFLALAGVVVIAVLIRRGLTKSNPRPTISLKLLYATYLLAGIGILALIDCGPYNRFYNAARPRAAGS